MGDAKILTDTIFMDSSEYELTPGRMVEGRGGGKWKILGTLRGQMGVVDEPTANGRRYPSPIIKNNLSRIAENLASRGVYGELDHPADGRTLFQRVSHIITDLHLEGKVLKGSWDIIETPNGRIMAAVCKAGGRMGASTRGSGTTTPGKDGYEDVNDDYRFISVDGVVDPAAKDSYPKLVAEAKSMTHLEEMVVTYEVLAKDFPGLKDELVDLVLREHRDKVQVQVPDDIGAARDALKVEFEEKLTQQKKDLPLVVLETLGSFRGEVAEQERSKLLSTLDPVLDRGALEDISRVLARRGIQVPEEYEGRIKDLTTALNTADGKAQDAQGKLESLQRETDILTRLSIQASMMIAAERRLGGKTYREAVLGMVGNPEKYEDKESFVEAIDKAAAEFEKKDKENENLRAEGTQDQWEKERQEHRDKLAELEKRLGEIEKSHAAEMEEQQSSHELEISELKADLSRVRRERDDASGKIEKALEKYDELYREAKRVEREANDDEVRYEAEIAKLRKREEKLKSEVEDAVRRVQIEQMLTGRPDADRLRSLVMGTKTVEEAAKIIQGEVMKPRENAGGTRKPLAESVVPDSVPKPARGVQRTREENTDRLSSDAALDEEMSELGVTSDEILAKMPPSERPVVKN